MNYIYLRVSTSPQDAENQLAGITSYCADAGLVIDEIVRDTISGITSWRERALYEIIRRAVPDDAIIVAEISRIGRSTVDVLEFLRETTALGIKVIVTKNRITVADDMQSRITTTVLALAAEIEREFLLARTAEGYKRAREAGVRVGRPPGPSGKTKIDDKSGEIAKLLLAGVSASAVSRLVGVSRGTVNRWKRNQKVREAQ